MFNVLTVTKVHTEEHYTLLNSEMLHTEIDVLLFEMS